MLGKRAETHIALTTMQCVMSFSTEEEGVDDTANHVTGCVLVMGETDHKAFSNKSQRFSVG